MTPEQRADHLLVFATESNKIERIYDERRHLSHAAALDKLLRVEEVSIPDLEEFVRGVEPGAFLRTEPGHEVVIAGRMGEDPRLVRRELQGLLADILTYEYEGQAWDAHVRYEMIHPFIDGNGRSGRALWLWQMVRMEEWDFRIPGFLHMAYYEALRAQGTNPRGE